MSNLEREREEGQPLLPEPTTAQENTPGDSADMPTVIKRNAWGGPSALSAQVSGAPLAWLMSWTPRAQLSPSPSLTQLLAVAFVAIIYTTVFTRLPFPPPLFGYHPLLQSISLLFLLSSILTLQPTNQSTPRAKATSLTLHQRLNLFILLPALTAGASIMFYLHHPASHWISWHGILGTATIVWMWVQALFGGLTVWQRGKWLGGEAKAKSWWKWHRLSGYILIPLFFV